MQPVERVGAKWVYLDLARGLAALAVAAEHLRTFVFVDFGDVAQPALFWRAFYFSTGLGLQAVMVFFVLSGFLVGKSILDNVTAGTWSWTDYAVRRLTRLWIVLIPALILTAVLDYIGANAVHGALYAGLSTDLYNNSTPAPGNVTAIYRPETFLANLLFLQTIVAPTFGTNGPLWSLANEFWYYIIFPLGVLALRGRGSTMQRTGYAVAAVIICILLPFDIVLYGLVWLFGFGVALTSRRTNRTPQPIALFLSLLLFLSALAAARLGAPSRLAGDFACGAAFAVTLHFLVKAETSNPLIGKIARSSAGFSYTLYLTHFPMLALFASAVLSEQRIEPSIGGLALYFAVLLAVALYAYAIYWLFERNTEWVRQRLYGYTRARVPK